MERRLYGSQKARKYGLQNMVSHLFIAPLISLMYFIILKAQSLDFQKDLMVELIFSQRAGITATELRWKDSEIVENKFLWTWDARPYPEWPNCKDVWADGACWERGIGYKASLVYQKLDK